MMQSSSPQSYMAARHGSHSVVISCYWSLHIRRLQLILGLRWWPNVTHSEIRSRAVIPTIESMLLHRQLRWLGHVIRMPHCRLPHCVLHGQLRLGHRSVGGQKNASRITSCRSLKSATFLPFLPFLCAVDYGELFLTNGKYSNNNGYF